MILINLEEGYSLWCTI
ncbi:TPA: hypothetical protein ROY20_005505 [Bacillus cereus]|uniref:Uncharacterized protein n=1 Tax=Bacillus cereus TaxID=1396 RepID=A0A9X8IZG4_BACCE|nr:hypothetical protein DR116_0016100 [Bacillus cereus]HDX9637569.1 hypothetical protein [Bacillus cereus]HEF1897953.1 hypothetical protein [Bacillus cereus]